MIHQKKHPNLDVDGCFGCKISGVRFNGVVSMRAMREAGTSGAEVAKENRENFINDHGYEPVPADDRYRWL